MNWYNAGLVRRDLEKRRLGQVEMLARRVAPSSIVARLVVVRGAEVGGGDRERWLSRLAPLVVVDTFYLIASPAGLPIVEQGLAQCCCLQAIPFLLHIVVAACSLCTILTKFVIKIRKRVTSEI